jgi:competence protein ComEC
LCIHYIDVGLGDAMLIEAPHGTRLLVDGGGSYGSNFDIGRSVIAPFLLAKKIVTLDYVINTHPHQDHFGGLQHVLQHFDVRNFGGGITGPEPRSIRSIAAARAIPVSGMRTGDIIRIGSDLDIRVLNALPAPDRVNESSLVLKLTYGGITSLLTGDIGEDVERSLIGRSLDLRANVLKVPHHGSRHSSTLEFIRSVRPDIAILSAGPGIRGIPSDEAITRYRLFNIPLYRTDRDGCIRVCTDGKNLTVHTENP